MRKTSFFTREIAVQGNNSELILQNDYKKVQDLAFCSARTARSYLSYELATKYHILPLNITKQATGSLLTIICRKNFSGSIKQEIAFHTGLQIQLMEIDSNNLLPAIRKAYQGDQDDLIAAKVELLGSIAPAKKLNLSYQEDAQNPESKFIKSLLDYALAKEASDIHIIPKISGTFLKIRIDGELFEHPERICSLTQHQIIINRLKILSKLNISEQRLPQDGAISLDSDHAYQKLRLSIMPTIYGEKAVIRLPKNDHVPNLNDLGLDQFTLQKLESCLTQQVGLIILCGPTGSGKTTTIYSALKELSHKNLCLASIEDPVEIFLPNVDQTSIKPEINFNYQQALKNILRQDPDVLLIGEIRDRDSADIALQAALSGHLIFTSVHAGSVQQAINRLVHLNLDASFLAEALKLIINQRLIPCLCSNCKQRSVAEQSNKFPSYEARGCADCNYIGYKDRQLISETLLINDRIRQKIAENKFSVNNETVRSKFYRSYQNQLKNLFSKGLIDLITYRKYCNDEQPTISS